MEAPRQVLRTLFGNWRVSLLGIFLSLAAAGVVFAQASVQQQAYSLQHADVTTAAKQIRATVGEEVTVFPDVEGRRLFVQGPADQLARVKQLVTSLDQPAAPPAAAPNTAGHFLNAYPLPAERQAAAKGWAATFQSTNGSRVAYDDRTQQLLVNGPAELHTFVKQHVVAAPAAQPTAATEVSPILPPASATPTPPPAASGVDPSRLLLRHISPDALHARVQQLLDRQVPLATDNTGQWISFRAELSPNAGVMIEVHRPTGEVRLSGAPQQVAGWNKVLTSIDVPPTGTDTVTQLVATTPNTDPHIRKALQAVQAQNDPAVTTSGRLASMQFQPLPGVIQPAPQAGANQPAQQPGMAQPAAPPAGQPGTEQQTEIGVVGSELAEGAPMGPVQIQFIEGTDLIVIRGSARDIERVKQIINRIEQASAETVPQVEIYQLQHVESRSMAALLERIYTQVLTPRTGSVSITPLGKPNALLLVGRPENVQTAIELIQKIDLPVEPTSRFEVFPLQFASAAEAKEMIDEFLEIEDEDGDTPPALAPRARVVVDPRTNSLIVSASPRELTEIGSILRRIDVRTSAAVDEVRVFPVRNTLATDLAEVLRSAILGDPEGDARGAQTAQRVAALQLMTIDPQNQQRLQSGILSNIRITANAQANTLVVTAPAETMDLIGSLIQQLDRAPDAVAEIKVFTIQNGDAQMLADMLRTLFGGTEGGAPAFGAGESGVVPLTFSVDPRTNSIIAAGTSQDLAVAYAILLKLDASEVRQRQNNVYRLKNSYALDIANALNEWLRTERDVEISADIALSPFEQLEREVIVVPEVVSNSLIVSSTPRYYEEVERLIKELDARPAMVTIQVLIAEVRLNDTDEFGVELGLQDSILFDRSVVDTTQFLTVTQTTQTQSAGGATVSTTQQNIVNQPLIPGFNFNNQPLGNNASTDSLARAGNVGTQGLSNFALNRINPELGFGGFVFSASSNSVSALLRALQETRRLEVLSRPQVTALDNQQAIIQVGQRVPRIATTQITQFGQQNSVVYEPVGINLMVRPRISPDGMVVMELQAEKSQVGSEQEGIPLFAGTDGSVIRAPRIDQTIAYSTVAAASGQTIVLSGLLTKETFDIHRRVPLLADIPLLGDFFRYDSVSEERTELLIILTPRVIRSELDAEMIKQVESSRMSYVLCDVVNMHGPSGLKSRCDDWTAAEAPSIYPTEVPEEETFAPIPMTVPMGPTLEPTPADPRTSTESPELGNPAAVEPASFRAPAEVGSLQQPMSQIPGPIAPSSAAR